MEGSRSILTGQSCASDARRAVAEFEQQVRQPDTALVMFFCSTRYDLAVLADEMNRRFTGITVVGCTTAGEIGPAGYRDYSLSGMSFSAQAANAVVGRIDDLHAFDLSQGHDFAQGLVRRLELQAPEVCSSNTFGLMLIDGLSMREEPVTHALQGGLGAIHMIGGSAGDDLKFERTWVFVDGEFRINCAALILVSTTFPFQFIKTQHFVSDGERMVVTEVDAARRIVKEINGLPAVEEYARIVGVPPESLAPEHFAASPVVVMIDGTDFVRSIQHSNPDGSLTFYCAIDDGVVLRVAHGLDMHSGLQDAIDDLRGKLGEIQSMLVCDCILRNLEAVGKGNKEAIGDLFRNHNAVGFSTYGEQYAGVHINQTLTGIAFGARGGHDA